MIHRRQIASPYGFIGSLRTTMGRQTATLFSAQAVNAILGLVIAFVLTTALSANEYGRYQFLVSVFTITMVFFDFGLNPAVKRLAAIADGKNEREILGGAVLYSIGLGLLLAITLLILSFFIETWFDRTEGSGVVLRFMAPFALLYPLYELIISTTQGANRITLVSAATVFPRVVFIVALLTIGALTGFGSTTALVLFLVSFGVTAVAAMLYLRPKFTALSRSFRTIFKEIREFGFNLYYGRVIDGITNGFDKVLITRYHGLAPTGYYGLALTLVLPVSMFSRAVAVSAYKRFTVEPSISRKTVIFNTAGCLISGAGITVLCLFGVPLVFPDTYTASLGVLPYLAAGTALAGLNAPYHAFLGAKRQGKDLRTMSFITSGTNIGLNLILVPLFAMIGAAVAYISTYALNLALNIMYYRRYLAREGENGS